MAKEIFCSFGVDVDAVAGWLGSYGGEDSPDDISRGLFAGEVGSLRLVKLFDRFGIKTTWFIPGHSIETFPDQMRAVVDVTLQLIVRMALFVAITALNLENRKPVILKFAAIRRLSRCSAGLLKVCCRASYDAAAPSFQGGFS